MARRKLPNIPNMSTGKSGTSSTVKNVSNTGQMSTSTQKTGATGAVTNTTNISSVAGPTSPSVSPSVTWGGGTNFKINPSLPTSASDSVRGAYAHVEGELASARQRALGMVPSEYRDRVNEHFDRASTQISEHRKKMGY